MDSIPQKRHPVLVQFDRPIAFHPIFVDLVGNIGGAVFLSQLIYWTSRGKLADGWIYKTYAEWHEETRCSRRDIDNARAKLKELGILEEKLQGVPATMHYRLDLDALHASLYKITNWMQDVSKQFVQNDKLYNESETTTETTTEITDSALQPPVTDLFGDVLPPRNVNIPKPLEQKPVKETEITAATVRKDLQDGVWKRAVEVAWRSYCIASGQAEADADLWPKCVWTPYDFKILKDLLSGAHNDVERFEAACKVYYRYDNEYGRKSGFALGMFRTKWQECITVADRGIRAKRRHIDPDARSESNDSNRPGENNEPVTAASLLRRFNASGTTSAG
jgi:hypothetical protein